MNLRGIISGLLLFVSATISAQDMHSLWLNPAVVVDGDPQDWPQPFRYYDPETKLQYAVANDSSNLYICLKVTDEAAQMRLFRAGLNIWIDPKGKRKEAIGVSFPMRAERSGEEGGGERRQRTPGEQGYKKPDIARLKQRVLLQQIALKLQGFNNIPDQVIGINNNYGITAAINWDSLDILCIEYKIPILSSLKHNLMAADTLKPVGLGFVVNAMEMQNHPSGNQGEEDNSMQQQPGGMNNRGMNGGGMGGSGMGGGRSGGGMGGNGIGGNTGFGSVAQEQKVWAKLTLSLR